jgi:predicted nucleotidyltransferase
MFKYKIYNAKLDPTLWDKDGNINLDISRKLLGIANDFYTDSKLNAKLKDVLIIGSSASFNYTENSDIDLHLVVDFTEIGDNKERIQNYLDSLKSKWNDDHSIFIKNKKVEVYLQDVNKEMRSSGIYSLMKGMWVRVPKKEELSINKDEVIKKYKSFENRIKEVESSQDLKKIDKMIEELYKMRNDGLNKGGELSAENIVFKILRSRKAIERLKNLRIKIYDKNKSIV